MMTLADEIRMKADAIKGYYGSLPKAFIMSEKEFYRLTSEDPLNINTSFDGDLKAHFWFYGMELRIRNDTI